MLNSRAIATLGVGYSPMIGAHLGLWPVVEQSALPQTYGGSRHEADETLVRQVLDKWEAIEAASAAAVAPDLPVGDPRRNTRTDVPETRAAEAFVESPAGVIDIALPAAMARREAGDPLPPDAAAAAVAAKRRRDDDVLLVILLAALD